MVLRRPLFFRMVSVAGTALVLSGCVTSRDFNLEGVMNLKRLGENQKQISRELAVQERQFRQLQDDVAAGRLSEGLSREEIIARYGEPVYTKPLSDRLHVKEAMVYRHPIDYFSSPLFYLYLDEDGSLAVWEKMQEK